MIDLPHHYALQPPAIMEKASRSLLDRMFDESARMGWSYRFALFMPGFIGPRLETVYQVPRSLRFNPADSARLSRTFSTGNRRKFTVSVWVKRSKLGAQSVIFGSSDAVNGHLEFTSTDELRFIHSGSSATTTAKFRDTGAFMHVVLAVDTEQATAANRFRFYINGTEYTNSAGIAQNVDTEINKAQTHYIGLNFNGSTDYFGGYMANFYFVDGQQLAPSSFGETSLVTGEWNPKEYSGSFGTNGFWLSFANNSSVANLGLDDAGGAAGSGAGSNDWTVTNFSVTAGSGNDSLTDTPSGYGTDTGVGGEVRGNYCTLNALTKTGAVALSNGDLEVVDATNEDAHVFGTFAVDVAVDTQGYYFEFQPTTLGANHYVGVAQNRLYSGPNTVAGNWVLIIGTNSNGVTNGNGSAGSDLGAIAANDIVMVAIKGAKIWFGVNGTWFGSGNPATEANPAWSNVSGNVSPLWGNGGTSSPAGRFNFGQRPFAHTAPSGFKALCTQNLPDPTIKKSSQYVAVNLRTGTGSAYDVSGLSFQPNFIWGKRRDNAGSNFVADSVRGAGRYITTGGTAAETINSQTVTAFNTSGYSGGTATVLNTSGGTYAEILMNEGTTPGFDIVTYTGDGTANRNIAHGLGVAPGLVIVKRTDGTSKWWVWHKEMTGATYFQDLSSTAAQSNTGSPWGTGNFSTTHFMVSNGTENSNVNGATYVAYVWAEVPGFSKFTRYTGNGSADGPFVHLGFKPLIYLYKRMDSTSDWQMLDTSRDAFNVAQKVWYPQYDALAEDAARLTGDFLAAGFKSRDPATYGNINAASYLVIAFARIPFKYARAR